MSHIGRSLKNVEAPRPLKSQSRSSLKNSFMVMEELIQLIESVAISLQSGINQTEPMAVLVQNLRIHGPQLESVSKDTLDRAFVVFRNASQDERLNIMTRLNLLELIELRAKGWEDNGINTYYKTKQATNAELSDNQHLINDPTQTAFLSTSPTFGGAGGGGSGVIQSHSAAAAAALAAAIESVGSANQQHLLLGPGEIIRNSGKFPKPTKIPGKTYCKDEVVIRNADSGKVNPGAKERLVQITGPAEDKINYAKQLIEDTIRRNASPVRLEPAMGSCNPGAAGSCSSLASSNSDEPVQQRIPAASNLSNRLSFNSAQNFMTAQQIVQQQHLPAAAPLSNAGTVAGKSMRPQAQMLLHSYSTNDASLGEYKFTCNVGQHIIKITGDCCDLVRVAKLVLDDYFSSAEFLQSMEAGAAFEGSLSTPTTPITGAPQFILGNPASSLATDSGIGLNYMSAAANNSNNSNQDGDDDVFVEGNNLSKSASQSNGLSRSRRSHFSRKDSTPEAIAANPAAVHVINRQKSDSGNNANKKVLENARIIHQYEHLLYYSKSPFSWALPAEFQKICEKFPAIVRNKVNINPSTLIANSTTTTTTITTTASIATGTGSSASSIKASPLTLRVACHNSAHSTSNSTNFSSITIQSDQLKSAITTNTTTTASPSSISRDNVTNKIYVNNNNNNSNNNNNNNVINNINDLNNLTISTSDSTNTTTTNTTTTTTNTNSTCISNQNILKDSNFYNNKINPQLSLNIRRKGFFNRQTYSIDEEGYFEEGTATPSPQIEVITPNLQMAASTTGGSGRLHTATLNRQLASLRTGPMTAAGTASLISNGLGSTDSLSSTDSQNTRQKLLNKQMKIISDIMVESSKTNSKLFETNKNNPDEDFDDVDHDDEDDDVEFIEIIHPTSLSKNKDVSSTTNMRPKLNHEFRSFSTVD